MFRAGDWGVGAGLQPQAHLSGVEAAQPGEVQLH